MQDAYAQALWQKVSTGTAIKEAVASVIHALQRRGRATLMPRVLHAFKRISDRESRRHQEMLYVAKEHDGAHAKTLSGAHHAHVAVDESLIGGWRLESGETLKDASFKKYLLDMYNAATK